MKRRPNSSAARSAKRTGAPNGMSSRLDEVRALIARRSPLAGLLVRSHGSHLILSREEALHPNEPAVTIERGRLSWIGGDQYSLSARDWQGKRSEPMPFAGSPAELLDLLEQMAYLIAPLMPPTEGAGGGLNQPMRRNCMVTSHGSY